MARGEAYDMVQAAARKVWAGDGDLLVAPGRRPAASPPVWRPKQLASLFDPSYHLRGIEVAFARLGTAAERMATLTHRSRCRLFRRGKVREMYAVGDDRLLMVASDRVSAFDVVMDEPIPGKGAVLTALSAFWFRKTADLVRQPRAAPIEPTICRPRCASSSRRLRGRWLLVRRAERIDIECVVRGYLAGSGVGGVPPGWAPWPANRCLPGCVESRAT